MEKDLQFIGYFKNNLDSAIVLIRLGEIKKQRVSQYLTLLLLSVSY